MRRRVALAVAAGLLVTAALPPFGWWPLAFAGIAVVIGALDGTQGWPRAAVASGFGLGFLVVGLWWMHEFTLPGYVLATLFETVLVGLGLWVPRRRAALTAGIVLAEALRASWPWGGVPVPTIAQTQVGGPLLQVARVGGELLITAAVVAGGIALIEAWRRRWVTAASGAAAIVVLTTLATNAPRPDKAGELTVAIVQGGGERGTRALDTDEAVVFERHIDASQDVERGGVDLVLWPENVVHVDEAVVDTAEGEALSALAASLRATLVAGVVIGGEAERDADVFINLAAAWGPDGEPLGRYEKNTRVPFGEFIPFRSLIDRVADLSYVPRDARVGHEPGYLETPAGPLGVVISWEVFFADRARDAISTGGEVLLVPTNAASFGTSQMPALELGAARLRAVETGRDLAQAAPTGFSAVVDLDGDVHRRSDLGDRAVIRDTLDRRRGRTIYTRLGDGPFVAAATLTLVLGGILRARAARSRPEREESTP